MVNCKSHYSIDGTPRCDMNGEAMMDRDMKVISSPPAGSPSSRSTDVVFIVEAKDCNRALRTRRKIDTVAQALEEEFLRRRFRDNRYGTHFEILKAFHTFSFGNVNLTHPSLLCLLTKPHTIYYF